MEKQHSMRLWHFFRDLQRLLWKRLQFEWRTGLWHFYKRHRQSITVNTEQGKFVLPLAIDDPISKGLFLYRGYEAELMSESMDFIRQLTQRKKGRGTIVDIGANNGIISIGMLVSGELDRAVAIEADPDNFFRLEHNVKINQLEHQVCCLNYAVSAEQTILQFELSADNYGDHRIHATVDAEAERFGESTRRLIEVQAETLDHLLADQEGFSSDDIAVVWIDVQGHEGYVFRGARDLFATGVPVVVEIWPYGIRRSGMSREAFCELVKEIWSLFWVKRRGRYVSYPVEMFYTFYDELGNDGDFDNVIFTL